MADTRILIVEDEGVTALHIRRDLEMLGYAVCGSVASGEHAIQKAIETRPDLVLMDIQLQGKLDGVQAAQQIREQFDIPIVYLTAHSDASVLQRAQVTEPYGYLLKPFEEHELRVTIEMALSSHRLKKQLKESEARYRELADSITDVFFAMDQDLRCSYWNKASEQLTGLSAQEAIGKYLHDLFPEVRGTRVEQLYLEAIRTLHPQSLVTEYQLGRRRFFEITAYPAGGGLAVFVRDITGRKQVEQDLARRAGELAAINRASQAMASTLELDKVLGLVIAEIRNLVNAEEASVLLQDGQELIFAATASDVASKLVGMRMPVTAGIAGWVMKEKQPVLVCDVSSDPRFYDGIDAITQRTTRSIMAVPLMVKGAASGVIEVVNKTDGVFGESDLAILVTMAGSAAIAIENARLYQAEQEQYRRLRQSQAQLIQVEKMAALGRLIASIAHEINNPLQAVQGCLTLAQEELDGKPRPDKLKRYLGMANDEIERVSAIVRRMRDFYRPTREEFQSTDVCIVLNSVLELTAEQLQHSNVTVEREGFGDGSGALPTVWANPNHLKQVFLNLVLNAVDAMSSPVDGDRQGGTLRVCATLDQMVQQDHPLMPAVRIELSDTGQGMPPQVLSRLFEPFHTTKANGTGLGLAISYEIVRAHNGQISATSQVGVGTTFTVLLPVEQV